MALDLIFRPPVSTCLQGSELLAEKSMKKPYCRSLVRKKDFDFSLKWRSCLSISVVHFKLIFDQHVDLLLIIPYKKCKFVFSTFLVLIFLRNKNESCDPYK